MCRIPIICGGLERTTALLWSDRSVFFRVILCGLTSVFTAFFTSALLHRRSQDAMKWSRPYVGMIPATVPVNQPDAFTFPEAEMYNPQDPNMTGCQRCGKSIWMSPANSIFYLFTVQPWVSYWMIVCPDCNQPHRCFIRDNLQWEYEWCQRNDVGVITEAFPTADQLAGFEETYQVHELSPHNLSDYEEKEVAFFRYLLEHHSPQEELE